MEIKVKIYLVEHRRSRSKPHCKIVVGRDQTESCSQGEGKGVKRALVCPRRYRSASRPVDSRTAAAASLGSFALSTAAGARILYLKGGIGVHGAGTNVPTN